jgi:PAS domain S-box-containing protein
VTGWPVIVTVSVPVDSGLAPFRRALMDSLASTGGVLVALGVITGFAMRLSRREEAAQAELAVAHAALLRARDELEQRVAERTRDLGEANHRLRENEARFRGIFNATFQFILLLEPDGTLLESNEAALAFIGRKPEEVVGRPFWETPWWALDLITRDRLRDALRRAAAGEFIRYEVEVAGTGDDRALMDFSLKPVRDAGGGVVVLVAEGRDITALKATEARLHAAQKLETLGQLTGGVAHDFNNLLMAVLGNLGLLRKRLPDDPRLQRLLDGAMQGAERGAALTQRLLAFARRQELRPEAIDLVRLVDGMSDLLHRSLGPGIDLWINLPQNLPPVRADANQLEMALLNLALNARDAMGGSGRLTIAAAPGKPGSPAAPGAGQLLCISVSDTGSGMDAATLQRATEPFFTTKGPGKGSGLGLSMVHGLAAQSGGQLRLHSAPGKGTTVELWLPTAGPGKAPAEAAPAPPGAPAPKRPLSILVVDDDPLIQAGTAAMLEDLGHSVDIASSGAAALEALDRGSYALMVTDFAMPGMTGLALIRAVQQRWHGLPVILATGYAELPEGEQLDVPRLTKPYRQEDLMATIAEVMARQQRADNVVSLPLGQRR